MLPSKDFKLDLIWNLGIESCCQNNNTYYLVSSFLFIFRAETIVVMIARVMIIAAAGMAEKSAPFLSRALVVLAVGITVE